MRLITENSTVKATNKELEITLSSNNLMKLNSNNNIFNSFENIEKCHSSRLGNVRKINIIFKLKIIFMKIKNYFLDFHCSKFLFQTFHKVIWFQVFL